MRKTTAVIVCEIHRLELPFFMLSSRRFWGDGCLTGTGEEIEQRGNMRCEVATRGGRPMGEASQHDVDCETQAKLNHGHGERRVRLAEQGYETVDPAWPSLHHELRIEVAIRLQSMKEAHVAEAGLAPLRKQLDLRLDERTEDVARRRGLGAFVQCIEQPPAALHESWHLPIEQRFEEGLLGSEVIVDRRRREARLGVDRSERDTLEAVLGKEPLGAIQEFFSG
jgi:hypothetical protein